MQSIGRVVHGARMGGTDGYLLNQSAPRAAGKLDNKIGFTIKGVLAIVAFSALVGVALGYLWRFMQGW